MSVNELTDPQLNDVISACPEPVLGIMQAFPRTVFLAGGAIASILLYEEPSDMDLFCSAEKRGDAEVWLMKEFSYPSRQSEKSITFSTNEGLEVQLIRSRDFTKPEDVLYFDFVHCQCSIWFEGGKFHSFRSLEYLNAIGRRTLIYSGHADDILHTADRMRKFLMRDWKIESPSFSTILTGAAEAIYGLGLKKEDVQNRLQEANS